MKSKSFFLLSLLMVVISCSLQLPAMVHEKKIPIEDSFHDDSFAVTENTEQNRRQYEPQEADDDDLSFQDSETQEEETTDADSTQFSEGILSQRSKEAQETAAFWKKELDQFGRATSPGIISSDAERISIIEHAHRTYDYWAQISHQCSDFLEINREGNPINEAQEKRILDLIEAADRAATEAQGAFDLLVGHDLVQKTDIPNQSVSPTRAPLAKPVIAAAENERVPKTYQTPSIPSNRPAIIMEEGYLFPSKRGGSFNNRWYTEHALERMAPSTPEIIALLHARAIERAKKENLNLEEAKFDQSNPLKLLKGQSDSLRTWWYQHRPDPRAILPSMVEAEIADPGSTHLKVITSPEGAVITVINKMNRGNSSRIFLRKSPIFSSQKPITLPQKYNALKYNAPFEISPSSFSKFDLSPLSQMVACFDQKNELSQSMSFAAHESRQKKAKRLLKNIKAITALHRKRDRDLKIKRSQNPFFWNVDQSTQAQVKARKEAQLAVSMGSYDLLEPALQKMKKNAVNNARNILKRPFRRQPNIIFKNRPTTSTATARLKELPRLKRRFVPLIESTESTQKQNKPKSKKRGKKKSLSQKKPIPPKKEKPPKAVQKQKKKGK